MIGPLPYIGGKNRLAKKIISMLPEHTTYVEAFAGGAQVFFHKPPSNVEVLNDLDFDIVNFYRVCQWHYEEFVRYLRFSVASRKLHELHVKSDPATLTDIQRAGRFFYLQKNSFGGLVLKQKFHYGIAQPSNYNPERIPEIIERTHQRLARVQIESLPYEQVLEKYDHHQQRFLIAQQPRCRLRIGRVPAQHPVGTAKPQITGAANRGSWHRRHRILFRDVVQNEIIDLLRIKPGQGEIAAQRLEIH